MTEQPLRIVVGGPEGLRRAELKMPPLSETVAAERIWLGDYLIVSDADARPVLWSELADHNGYAAENAEPGAAVRYYKRGAFD